MGFFSLQNEYIRVPAPCSQSNLRPFKEFSRRRKQSENVRHIPYVANKAYNFHYMFGESMTKITLENGKTI